MARIIYALSGQGRGHTSRVIAVSEELRQNGHEVLFCCGGTAREILEKRDEKVLPVPALRQTIKANRICLMGTIRENWQTVLYSENVISRLTETFARLQPDLLITDFEAFSPRAAERINLPTISFNHQQVVTEASYDLPLSDWSDAAIASFVIQMIAPSNPAHILLTSFFFPPLKRPDRTAYVPPIIRSDVQDLVPSTGEHVLVYYNQTQDAKGIVKTLAQIDAQFVLYNFEDDLDVDADNLHFKQPSIDGFLEDLRTARAVICTAGFTLSSEALYLGKPLLVVPNRGIFEQKLNAYFLEREGLGETVSNGAVKPNHVTKFLSREEMYRERLQNYDACGNSRAIRYIEQLLKDPSSEFQLTKDQKPEPALN